MFTPIRNTSVKLLALSAALAFFTINCPAQSGTATNSFSIRVEGNYRIIEANGFPNHPTGAFPNPGNPNKIAAQKYSFRIPLHPVVASNTTSFKLGLFGIALNGVVFDPGAAEWWNRDRNSAWQYEPMTGHINLGVDKSNAHVQPNGAYHYHGIPLGLIAATKGASEHIFQVGWAADGFPIYAPWGYTDANNPKSPLKPITSSYRLKKGTRPDGPMGTYDGTFVADFEYVAGAGDLDECNGRFGITPEFSQGTYHYFVTKEFPFIPRKFRGTADPSFMRQGPPPGGGNRRGPEGMRGPDGPGRPPGPPPGGGLGGPPDRN